MFDWIVFHIHFFLTSYIICRGLELSVSSSLKLAAKAHKKTSRQQVNNFCISMANVAKDRGYI